MTRAIFSVVFALTTLVGMQSRHDGLSQFKAVEAYEIQPGILMVPRYTAGGEFCEVGLQKLHYSPGKIRLNPSLTSVEIDQIVNQLVPGDERGPKPKNRLEQGTTDFAGNSAVTNEEYQNVSVHIYSALVDAPVEHTISVSQVAATIVWKHRKCK